MVQDGLLAPLRVLDLTDEWGYLCGRVLGDMGADVIKIEKPGGDPGRRLGPFYQNHSDPQKSLYWFAYNANKRGITLNIETAGGKDLLQELAKTADAVVESFPAGYMDRIGLGYEYLCRTRPAIIYTAITPFGQSGPYSSLKGSDIVVSSMSGLVYACGDPDKAPVRIPIPQSYLFAGIDGAIGTAIAYYHREVTREGQYVDVSAQAGMYWTAGPLTHWTLRKKALKREGQFRGGLSPISRQRHIWRCKDGHVAFQVYGGGTGAKNNSRLTQWMDEKGMASDFLRSMNWEKFSLPATDQELMDNIEEPIGRFFLSYTKAELEAEAMKRDIILLTVSDMKDVLASPQLKARDYWIKVEHPELDCSITYPGPWAKLSSHGWKMRFRAPLIGEHNEDIYGKELGLSRKEMVTLKESGVI